MGSNLYVWGEGYIESCVGVKVTGVRLVSRLHRVRLGSRSGDHTGSRSGGHTGVKVTQGQIRVLIRGHTGVKHKPVPGHWLLPSSHCFGSCLR